MSSLPIDPHPDASPLRLSDPDPEHPREHDSEHAPASPDISAAHLEQIEQSVVLAKPIEKAVRYAQFSGWTTLIAGVGSLLFAFGNPALIIFTVCVSGIGTREITLGRKLKVLDRGAPKKLAINQLLLGGALIGYAIYMLLSVPGEGMVESAMKSDPMMQSTPEIAGMMNDMAQLEQLANALMYVLMIVSAVFIQGGTALYYALKGKKLAKLYQQTPPWVIEVYQRVHR